MILCEDGRVELKLKEAEIEQCIEELQKKEAHIQLQFHHRTAPS